MEDVAEWSPQDVTVLIPRACEYVTSHSKSDFADIIKLYLDMERLSWITWMGPM